MVHQLLHAGEGQFAAIARALVVLPWKETDSLASFPCPGHCHHFPGAGLGFGSPGTGLRFSGRRSGAGVPPLPATGMGPPGRAASLQPAGERPLGSGRQLPWAETSLGPCLNHLPLCPPSYPLQRGAQAIGGGGGWWDLAWKGPERQEPSRVVRDGRAFALEKAAGMKAKLAGVLNTRGDATCTPLHNHVHPCTATQPLRVLQATPLGGIWPKRPHSNRTEGLSPLSCPDSSHQPPPTVTQGTHLPPLRHIYPPGRRWAQPHPSPSSWWWARGEARAADSVFSRQCYTERKGERLKPGKE